MSLNVYTGVVFAMAGCWLGLRQILLLPRHATFPCAPKRVTVAMFLVATSLAAIGVLFYGRDDGPPFAGEAANVIAALATVVALYNGVMLWNVIRQRRPRVVWNRIRRIDDAWKAAPPAKANGKNRDDETGQFIGERPHFR